MLCNVLMLKQKNSYCRNVSTGLYVLTQIFFILPQKTRKKEKKMNPRDVKYFYSDLLNFKWRPAVQYGLKNFFQRGTPKFKSKVSFQLTVHESRLCLCSNGDTLEHLCALFF